MSPTIIAAKRRFIGFSSKPKVHLPNELLSASRQLCGINSGAAMHILFQFYLDRSLSAHCGRSQSWSLSKRKEFERRAKRRAERRQSPRKRLSKLILDSYLSKGAELRVSRGSR